MLNDESLQAVSAAHIDAYTVKPLYESFCFSCIPGTIYNLLTGENDPALPPSVLTGLPARYDKVILLFIDAFGWRFFERYADHFPFLKRFITDSSAVASKLTSQFPSTTAAHYTTIQTGIPVGVHGIFEKSYYEPLVDDMIAPLGFVYGVDKGYTSLHTSGVEPRAFLPKPTISERLDARGVRAYFFQDRDTYSDLMVTDAHAIVPFRTFAETLVNIREAVLNEPGRAYYFMYYGMLDYVAHRYGPDTPQFDAEAEACFAALERLLYSALAGKAKNTLLLFTADHGHMEISPQTTMYVNLLCPALPAMLRTNRAGGVLGPAGSPRDLFLYIRPEYLHDAHDMLTEACAGRADVCLVRDLIADGWFNSGSVSDTFLGRAADLVVLPYDRQSAWWFEEGRYVQDAYGYHGGTSAKEMETLLLVLPL